MGIDRPGGTDTHAENVEKPPAEDRPAAPPPDRPGSPGQPSRLESLRAAREAQEARRAETGTQQTAPQETGAEQRDEREKDRGESSSAEPADKEPDAQAGPKLPERGPGGETESDTEAGSGDRDRETDRSGSEIGQARPDGRGEQPYAAATGELTPEQGTEPRGEVRDDKAEPSYDGPADERPDAPAEPQTDEDRPMTGETEPEDPQDRDHQPLPQQDGRVPGDDGNDSRGGAGNEQQPQADDQPAGHDNTPQDEPAPADQQDSGSETQQAAEAPVRASENPEPGDAPLFRVAWLPAAEEGVTRWTSPVVQFNEQMPGNQIERRDRNAEGRPGTLATTEDEPNKYRNLPELTRDGTPGRGELRPPEDDPVDRNPDPEEGKRSRWENYDRVNTAFDATKNIIKGVKDLQSKPSPTGQAESKTDVGAPKPEPHTGYATDPMSNGIVAFAALLSGGVQMYRNYRPTRRSEHADN
ncbi:hypothetical protein [Actinomadura livida]|uniref:Uncharacterized protein n=1 Tax=Actinomadura livida TaxID=79909 RepID=A0A7W7ICA4_9ACTN|nr:MULTISPECIES: hypothetical protein [Actinomadura]MBB4774459.1 hypothetical protein [Actinomadura catellatispora]GGT82388.1 hypothetical protein GCM10010208_00850 [Actinomadura livida]